MEAMRKTLLEKQAELESRIGRIGKHAGMLDQNSKERLGELQNEPVLKALDVEAREELAAIEKALSRMDKGTYTICQDCGEDIPMRRLEANPFSETCMRCMQKSG